MFLEVKDKAYIIDACSPISPMLLRCGIPHEKVKGVFITHMHGDHFDGLFEFADQLGWRYLNSDPRMLFSEEKGAFLIDTFLKTMVTTRRKFDLGVYSEGKIYEDENITVTAIPTDRSNLPSYAFLVAAEGKTILFSGDMNAEFTEYDRLFKNKSYDLVVFEGAHAVLHDNISLLASIDTKKMVINHLYTYRNPINDLDEIAKQLPYGFEAAYDLMKIEI